MRSISDAQQKKLSLHEKRNQGISDRLKVIFLQLRVEKMKHILYNVFFLRSKWLLEYNVMNTKDYKAFDKFVSNLGIGEAESYSNSGQGKYDKIHVNYCEKFYFNLVLFRTPADPATLSFKFGDIPVSDYAKVQRSYQIGSSNKNNSAEDRRSTRRSLRLSSGANSSTATPRMDVKQMTMSASRMRMKASTSGLRSVLKATTPVMTPRLERLATPKNARNISGI